MPLDETDPINAPLDDEPYTEAERAAADAALEPIRHGQYVGPLDVAR